MATVGVARNSRQADSQVAGCLARSQHS